MKYHPDKKIRIGEKSILMFFHNLTIDCYYELLSIVRKIPKKDSKIVFDTVNVSQTLLSSFIEDKSELLKTLSKKKARLLFRRHMEEIRT